MKKILFTAILFSALVIPAFADDSGFYLGIDHSTVNFGNLSPGYSQPAAGYRVDAGYDFNKNWGIEIGYFGSGDGADALGNVITPNSTYVAGIASYPINDSFGVFVKLGVTTNQITSYAPSCSYCSPQHSLMYGVGADYNFNELVGIRLQYENLGNMEGIPDDGSTRLTASVISLGLVLHN